MPEDGTCEQPGSSDSKKKKKKRRRKKSSTSNTPPEHTEKPRTASLPPETSTVSPSALQSPDGHRVLGSALRGSGRKEKERLTCSSRRRKRHPKDPPAPNGTSSHEALAQGSEPGAEDALRWEGVLEDPQAEERRLELYRANRRRRYAAQREAVVRKTQERLGLSKAFTETGRPETETPSLLHLSIDRIKIAN